MRLRCATRSKSSSTQRYRRIEVDSSRALLEGAQLTRSPRDGGTGLALTERVERWRSAGGTVAVGGHGIHTFRRDGKDPVLVLLHGFPSSSFDWRRLLEREREHAVLAFDFLGFGLSDKPREADYSIFRQADLTVELMRRELAGRPGFLVAHDMGSSVATELMARDLREELDADLVGGLLFNGSILLERASPTLGQKLLRTRAAPVFARLMNERFFRRQFTSLFSLEQPLDREEAADQWALIHHNGGHRLAHRLIVYHGRARALHRALARCLPRPAEAAQPSMGDARPGRRASGARRTARAAPARAGNGAPRRGPLPPDRAARTRRTSGDRGDPNRSLNGLANRSGSAERLSRDPSRARHVEPCATRARRRSVHAR